ncbi:hypothetical protein F4780DRAFT_774634 [Xylariomycetidae sp. FL0641]|nr:hypothetical protein F4780DRAFT_774634 [Xylariomycetidae sp. FL0641]
MWANPTSTLAALALSFSLVQAEPYVGCFSQQAPLVQQRSEVFNSVGLCTNLCRGAAMPVTGMTNGSQCLCGLAIPPVTSLVEDDACDSPCPGYAMDNCGGTGFVSVYLSGELEETSGKSSARRAANPRAVGESQ